VLGGSVTRESEEIDNESEAKSDQGIHEH